MMLRQGLALDWSCLFVPDVCVKKSWELRRITGSESAYIFLPFLPLSGLWLAAFQPTQAQIRTRRGGQGLGVCSSFWMLVSNEEHVLNISLN